MSTSSIFHVIDSKTFYKLLLGWPWFYEHGIVASTLHQCLKYYQDGERKVNDNVKPFAKAESHFADAKFFEEHDVPKETVPSTITSMGRGGIKSVLQAPKQDMPSHQLKKEKGQQGGTPSSIKYTNMTVATTIVSSEIVLRYIHTSQTKDG